MTDFKPRKLPKQARSQVSFDAILEAAARLLREGGYERLTTNLIAQQAGVGIATLYDFFPNKEAIVAQLTAQRMAGVRKAMEQAFAETAQMPAWPAVIHLTRCAVHIVTAERKLFSVLLRQIPFVPQLPAVQDARDAMGALAQRIRIEAGGQLDLPKPEEDTWLISQMLFNAILETALLDAEKEKRAELTFELARLVYRMAVGRDPERPRPARAPARLSP